MFVGFRNEKQRQKQPDSRKQRLWFMKLQWIIKTSHSTQPASLRCILIARPSLNYQESGQIDLWFLKKIITINSNSYKKYAFSAFRIIPESVLSCRTSILKQRTKTIFSFITKPLKIDTLSCLAEKSGNLFHNPSDSVWTCL